MIALGSYNGARFLDAQLDSLAAQSWTRWRLVVSDDGSTDATRDIVARFAAAHPARDVQLIEGPGQGATRNFLHLLDQAAQGEWLAFCDQDDVWLPERLDRGMAQIGSISGPAATASRTIICDHELRPLGPAPLFSRPAAFRNALVQACLPGNTFLANPAAVSILKAGAGAAAAAGVVSHDWWAYQLLSGAGATIIRDPALTVLYRQHRGNVMGRNDTMRARLARVALLGAGTYGHWLYDNCTALQGGRDLLTAENAGRLDRFQAALQASGPSAAAHLMLLGVYRQTRAGTAALLAAALAGRLRVGN
jgi:glycosyltransferase involved in cell wall biosynthesis